MNVCFHLRWGFYKVPVANDEILTEGGAVIAFTVLYFQEQTNQFLCCCISVAQNV